MLSVWIDDAVRSDDPNTVCHVYAADEAAEVMERGEWKAANLALAAFRSFVELEQLAEKAERLPTFENRFRYRSEECRIGKACVSTIRSRWWPDTEKTNKINKN